MEKVSKERYAEAVARFVQLARQGTSGGRVAAQVLLSAYNGFEFHLDVAGLCSLDARNYQDAITIIRGRYETCREPHTLIPHGGQVFQGLWDSWSHLHVTERGKETCPACDGRGVIFLNPDDERDDRSSTCSRYSGKGRICRCSLYK